MRTYQERANQLIQQGDQARSQGRIQEAARAYREAIALVPAYGSLHLVIADLYFEQEAYAEAAQVYQAAADFLPQDAEAWAGLGRCRLLLDQRSEALEAFETALKLAPEHPVANYYAAMLHALAGAQPEAEQRLLAVLRIRPAWEERARQDPVLGPLFASSRRLAAVGKPRKWWEVRR